MELTRQQEEIMLEESREKDYNKKEKMKLMDIKLEEDRMFNNFLDEFEPELRKEFMEHFECLEVDIENVYDNEWNEFCKQNFIEYLKDLEVCRK